VLYVKELLKAATNTQIAMLKTRNVHGSMPLHVACSHKWADANIVQTILAMCPDLSLDTDNEGFTPLHRAAESLAPTDVVEVLIKHERRHRDLKGACALLMLNEHENSPLDLIKDVEPELAYRERQTKNLSLIARATKLERKKRSSR